MTPGAAFATAFSAGLRHAGMLAAAGEVRFGVDDLAEPIEAGALREEARRGSSSSRVSW